MTRSRRCTEGQVPRLVGDEVHSCCSRIRLATRIGVYRARRGSPDGLVVLSPTVLVLAGAPGILETGKVVEHAAIGFRVHI